MKFELRGDEREFARRECLGRGYSNWDELLLCFLQAHLFNWEGTPVR
jgi:hypothetical protein